MRDPTVRISSLQVSNTEFREAMETHYPLNRRENEAQMSKCPAVPTRAGPSQKSSIAIPPGDRGRQREALAPSMASGPAITLRLQFSWAMRKSPCRNQTEITLMVGFWAYKITGFSFILEITEKFYLLRDTYFVVKLKMINNCMHQQISWWLY